MNSTLWHTEIFTDKRQGDRRGYAGRFRDPSAVSLIRRGTVGKPREQVSHLKETA